MQIFLACLQAQKQHAVPAYSFWEAYFKRGIEEGGHQWIEAPDADWVEVLTLTDNSERSRWRDRIWSRTLESIRQELEHRPIDLFLSYLYPEMIDSSAVREIRRLGIPCVNFFCDNVREFRKVPQQYHCFDLHWVPEVQALSMYAAAGLSHLHLPMPCWIPRTRRTPQHIEKHGPTFVGSYDPLRQHLLARAIELGATITIRGPGWQRDASVPPRPPAERGLPRLLANQIRYIRRQGVRGWLLKFEPYFRPLRVPEIPSGCFAPKVFGDAYMTVTQQSSVILGINRVHTYRNSLHKPVKYSRLRDIEAPMMGACYLTEYTPDLESFYELGHDIETYDSPEELADKIAILLADPERRQNLRRAGQNRALGELSVRESLTKINRALALVPKSSS